LAETTFLAETDSTSGAVPTSPTLATFDSPAYVEAGETYGLALGILPGYWGNWFTSPATDPYPYGDLRGLDVDDMWIWYFTDSDAFFEIYVVPDPVVPTIKEQCKNEGYKDFGFKSQGQCIKTLKDNT
jgi:hypothetical protein